MHYTLYKGNRYIASGTLEEIEEQTGRNRRNLQSILSKTKRYGLLHKNHNRLMLVPEDYEEDNKNLDYYLHKIDGYVKQAIELDGFDGGVHARDLNTIKDIARKLINERLPKLGKLETKLLPKEHWNKIFAWYEGDNHITSGTVYEIAKETSNDIKYIASRFDSKRGDALIYICDDC